MRFNQQARYIISLFIKRGGKIVVYSYTKDGIMPITCNTYHNIDEYESRMINPFYTEKTFFNHLNKDYDLVFFENGNVELIESEL